MAIATAWRSPDGDVDVYRINPRGAVATHLAELIAERRRIAPDSVRLCHGPNGKPFFPGGPEFSITHVDTFSLIAIGHDAPVGIDAERVRPIPEAERIAEMLFTAPEHERIRRIEGSAQTEAFYRAWVTLEAKIKARGEALVEYGSHDGLAIFTFRPEPDVMAALAIETRAKDPDDRGERPYQAGPLFGIALSG